MKVLVTGSTGFVGRSLCHTLEQEPEFEVFRGVRSPSGQPNEYFYGNLLELKDYPLDLSQFDAVIHLAARAHILTNFDPGSHAMYEDMNVMVTVRLAELAKQAKVKKFIFLSSIAVHGQSTKDEPFRPTDIPDPSNPYGRSKLQAELALNELRDSNFDVIIIRPPLIYGPGVKGNLELLHKVIRWRLPLPFKGVQNKRSLLSVNNLNSLIRLCLLHQHPINEPLLAADPSDLSLPELLKTLGRRQGIRVQLFTVPNRLLNILFFLIGKRSWSPRLLSNLQVDSSRTQEILDWQPEDYLSR